jgi:L-fucose isomerase-like protein
MSTVSSMLGAEAAPYTVEWKGKTYSATGFEQRAKSAWERAIQNEAKAHFADLAKFLAPEAQASAALEMAAQLAGVEYSFFGPRSMGLMKTVPGVIRAASILFGVSEADAYTLFMAKPLEVKVVVEAVFNESFAALAALGAGGTEGEEGNAPQAPQG